MLTVLGVPSLRWADAQIYKLHLFLRAWIEMIDEW
jgi:hypothetical protein